MIDMIPVESPYDPTPEDDRHYYSGVGHVELLVTAAYKLGTKDEVFEFELLDSSGCVGYMQEVVGLDYWLQHITGLHLSMRAGFRYQIGHITSHFTRGDGWTTDDDVDWEFEGFEENIVPWEWLKIRLGNAWWFHIGWRIRDWRLRRGSR